MDGEKRRKIIIIIIRLCALLALHNKHTTSSRGGRELYVPPKTNSGHGHRLHFSDLSPYILLAAALVSYRIYPNFGHVCCRALLVRSITVQGFLPGMGHFSNRILAIFWSPNLYGYYQQNTLFSLRVASSILATPPRLVFIFVSSITAELLFTFHHVFSSVAAVVLLMINWGLSKECESAEKQPNCHIFIRLATQQVADSLRSQPLCLRTTIPIWHTFYLLQLMLQQPIYYKMASLTWSHQ